MKLSAAEAKALGLDVKGKPARQRRTARGSYHTVCHSCGEEFTTQASEDRHLTATRHARYELVIRKERT